VIATLAKARTWRIIPSRYPIVGIWDRIADPSEIDDFIAIEGLTNERVRGESGEISRVRPKDRIAGPGATPIMSAFAHVRAGRFNDSTFAAYYAAFSEPAAIAETRYGRDRRRNACVPGRRLGQVRRRPQSLEARRDLRSRILYGVAGLCTAALR
jgi:hypothetical protein